MTTDARLRAAKRALLQAATLLHEAALLGTMGDRTREAITIMSCDLRDFHAKYVKEFRAQCNRDLDAVRQGKKRRAA